MDYVEESDGKPLSKYWTDTDSHKDPGPTSSEIYPASRYDRDFITLANRPLTFRLQPLENKGVLVGIDRQSTYSTIDENFSDLLSCHDGRIQHQAKSIRDQSDGETQLSVLAAVRALLPHFISRDLRRGPFVFILTDLHPNNIFVDDDWHIKSVIDLEWACVRPVELVLPPVWLTGRRVDQLTKGKDLDAYIPILEEFFEAFGKEEKALSQGNSNVPLTARTLRGSWESGKFWFFHGLDNPKVLCLFFKHILPIFAGASTDASNAEFRKNTHAVMGKGRARDDFCEDQRQGSVR
ncbi:hypothetical protein MMC18_007735 [Xylographa bjoerkii]|nr:hypothetical protein [Xylographa bjoerkii]